MSAALPKAPKIYPIHLLMTTNYRLPNDVDRYKSSFVFLKYLNYSFVCRVLQMQFGTTFE